jgi:hypothetical protein
VVLASGEPSRRHPGGVVPGKRYLECGSLLPLSVSIQTLARQLAAVVLSIGNLKARMVVFLNCGASKLAATSAEESGSELPHSKKTSPSCLATGQSA